MKINLDIGTYIQIGGELGKYNSLPIDTLIRIAQDFQELIKTIVELDLPLDETINIDNFIIELVDFKKGSAVPKFAFTPRAENKVGHNWQVHRNIVSEKFERIVEIANSGDYYRLNVLYPEPIKRNPIVENLYSFISDFGDSPVNFVEFDEKTDEVIPLYKINRFKSSVKKELIAEIKETEKVDTESNEAVGRIKIIKKGNKIQRKVIKYYLNNKYSLEYAPEVIIAENRKYFLKYPLRCMFEKEDSYFIIQSEMLGIIGTGLTEDDAELSFNQEFDFVFQRFNELDNSKLTYHNLLIKNIINQIVDRIEQ